MDGMEMKMGTSRILSILFFVPLLAQSPTCSQTISTKGAVDKYEKFCIEHQEYIGVNIGRRTGVLAYTGKKCHCETVKTTICCGHGTMEHYIFVEDKTRK